MAFTQKYTIISPVQPLQEGLTFNSDNWPLHVTLADTFAINAINDELLLQLRDISKGRAQVVKAEVAAWFGQAGEVEVMLLEASDELLQLHTGVVDLLLGKGAIFNDPQYIKSGFIGHVTQQTSRRVEVGESLAFDSLALIDMFPDGDASRRRVMNVISFKEN